MVVATTAIAFQIPPLTRKAIDALEAARASGGIQGSEVGRTVLWILALAAVGAVVRIVSRVMVFGAGRRIERDFRADFFRHLQRMDPAFFERYATGDLMSRATNDLSNVRLLIGPGILSATNFAVAYVLAITMMSRISVELLLYSLLPYPFVLALVRLYSSRLYKYSKEVQESLSDLTAKVEENLSGIGVVKAYALEGHEADEFRRRNDDYYARSRRLVVSRGLMFPLMGSLGSIGLFIVILVGGRKVIAGEITLGQFVEFSQYLMALAWPTAAMGWILGLYQRGIASLRRLDAIFEVEPAIRDEPEAEDLAESAGRIEIRGLTFRYPGERAFGLQDVSIDVAPGETVAIVGPTGAGKTTLVKLLTRLLPVPEGTIFVDGRDVLALRLDALRRQVAVVPQHPFLFSTTLGDNIVYGVTNGTAMSVEDAGTAAGLHKDVVDMPRGYETVLGERGITLSGGQRQRATLARALATRRPILILDDALSAVDAATEEEILAGISRELGVRTTLIISHRISAIRRADRIVVLDHGRVVETGTHDALLAQGGLYAELHHQQQIERELETL